MNAQKMFLFFVFFLMLAPAAFATTILIQSPAAGASISGVIQVTVVANDTGLNSQVCTLATSSVIAGGGSVLLNTSQMAGQQTVFLINTALAPDAADHIFLATCQAATDTNTGINIDNFAPSIPTNLLPALNSRDTDGSVILQADVVAASTSTCTFGFSRGSSETYTVSESGGVCSQAVTLGNNDYEWYVSASDGTNVSGTASSAFNVHPASSGAGFTSLPSEVLAGSTPVETEGFSLCSQPSCGVLGITETLDIALAAVIANLASVLIGAAVISGFAVLGAFLL